MRTKTLEIVPTCYLSPKAEGRTLENKGGRGVFAIEPISKKEVIAVWGGEVLNGNFVRNLPPSKKRLIIQVEEDQYLLSTGEGPADWINHSCEPNAGLNGQIVLVAMRDIAPEEEICFDYAMSDSNRYAEFECHCGRKECRKRFTRNDWRLPELWKRYEGYFSPYLQRRIDRFRGK